MNKMLKFGASSKDIMERPIYKLIGLIVLLMSVQFSPSLIAQESYTSDNCINRSGFEYGVMGGIFMANNKTADFYSGKPENENSVDYLMSNSYRYNEIKQLVDFHDTLFVLEYPGKMSYSPAFSFGLFVKYDFNCHTGIYAQFSYVKLNSNDVVTFEVDPKEYLTEPDIRLFPIKGVEERNMLDLGISHAIGLNKNARMTIGGGISMNNTLVNESAIYIEEKKYSLVNIYGNRPYVPGTNQQSYEIRQGGIGFGIYGNVGARLEFSPTIAIEPGVIVHLMKVNLEEHADFLPQYNFYLKLIFRDLLNFEQ